MGFPKRLSTRNTIRRRSSTRNSIRRRSSICRQKPLSLSEDNDDDENLPFHPGRAPRRSSIKGSCPTRARARRRASISTCTASSIEDELASGTLQPSQVLEIRVPRRRESIKRRTSITFHEDVSNVRKIQAISQVKGASVKQESGCQDIEYTQQIKKKICALIDKVDAASGQYDGTKYGTCGLEQYTSHNRGWSLREEEYPPSGPETSTLQYDHDHDNHDDATYKLYYSVYDDDDDDHIIMREDDEDNEYYEYEANNEVYEDDDTMTMIEYNMTYTELDDHAFFCQVTTNAETRKRSRPMNKVGKYRQ